MKWRYISRNYPSFPYKDNSNTFFPSWCSPPKSINSAVFVGWGRKLALTRGDGQATVVSTTARRFASSRSIWATIVSISSWNNKIHVFHRFVMKSINKTYVNNTKTYLPQIGKFLFSFQFLFLFCFGGSFYSASPFFLFIFFPAHISDVNSKYKTYIRSRARDSSLTFMNWPKNDVCCLCDISNSIKK